MQNSAELLLIPVGGGIKQSAEPARHREDENRWLDIKEYSVFLNDGILRSFGLVKCPQVGGDEDDETSVPSATVSGTDLELERFKNSSTKVGDVQERLLKLCNLTTEELRRYHNYQYSILQSMWLWKYKDANKTKALESSAIANVNPYSTAEAQPPGMVGSTLSLLLLVPLLKSQALVDKRLAAETANLLLTMFLDNPVMHIDHHYHNTLNQVESLFVSWIQEYGNEFREVGMSVMVALSCARGSLPSILKTIQLLQGQSNTTTLLPVKSILKNLSNMHFRVGKPPRVSASHHVATWQYYDHLGPVGTTGSTLPSGATAPSVPATDYKLEKELNWHAIAVDGTYLYVTSTHGQGLAKLGSGYNGSLQGIVYHRNTEISVDFLAYGNGILLARLSLIPWTGTDISTPFARVIDPDTLIVGEGVIERPEDMLDNSCSVIGFTSDGFYFYVISAQFPSCEPQYSEEDVKPINIFLSVYEVVQSQDGLYNARLVRPHILLKREVDIEPVPEEDFHRARISYLAATVQPPPPPVIAAVDPFADRITSLGIRLSDLTSASFIATGNYVNIVTEYSSTSPAEPTSPLLQSINRHFAANGGPTGLNNPKVTGTQIHICLHDSTPTYSKTPIENLSPRCSFQRGLNTIIQTGFAYDAVNNFIWSACGEYVDVWKNTGNIPPWKAQEKLTLTNLNLPADETREISVDRVMELLWSHVGLHACHALEQTVTTTEKVTEDITLGCIWDIVSQMDLKARNASELTSLLVILQYTISNTKIDVKEVPVMEQLQSLALSFFSDEQFLLQFKTSVSLYVEASNLLIQCFKHTCSTTSESHQFATELLKLVETLDVDVGNTLKRKFLEHLTNELEDNSVLFEKGQLWILPPLVLRKLIGENAVQNTIDIFDKNTPAKPYTVQVPLASPATAYVMAVVNCLLKSWTLGPILNTKEPVYFPALAVQIFKAVLNHSSTIVDRAIEFMMQSSTDSLEHHRNFLSTENILKSSLIGMALPQIYMWIGEHSTNPVCDKVHPPDQPCPVLEEVAEECVQLYVAISHLSHRMIPMNESATNEFTMAKIRPFQNYRLFESPHPIKENMKLKESVIFTGASHLYVKIDPRSATQYAFDKFVLYSGTGPNAKRIAECGGNFYGFANRGFWARDLVRVDGDTISYTLEVKSGREQRTHPEALWGFAFVVLPVYDSYTLPDTVIDLTNRTLTTKAGLVVREQFFIDKLFWASGDSMSCMLSKLMNGEPRKCLELEQPSLFGKKLFSRLKWPDAKTIPTKDMLLVEISNADIANFRSIGNCTGLPQMGKKIRDALKPEELEKLYVLSCLKFITKMKSSSAEVEFAKNEQSYGTFANPLVLRQIFLHLDSFIRKFVSIAEVQYRLQMEFELVLNGSKTLEDLCTMANSPSDLEQLACLFEFDAGDAESKASDLRSILAAFVAEGTCPQLSKAEELVEETILKLRYLIVAELTDADKNPGENLIEMVTDVHSFVFAHLENSKATMTGILEVATSHAVRASSRCQGLQLLLKLLQCSQHNASSVLMASQILQQSQRVEPISCCTLIPEVNYLTSLGIQAVVEAAKSDSYLNRHAIMLLCAIPYKREDEKTLVSSGLLDLLDTLCGVEEADGRNFYMEDGTRSTEAWAAFQVLAHCCSSWKTDDALELEHLPIMVSRNVTNHLARVTGQVSSETSDLPGFRQSEGMEEVLGLLFTLRFTKLGQEILKQSSVICRLLLILLDSRQPPVIISTIIRLLSTALPLVETLDISVLNQQPFPIMKKKGVKDPNPQSLVVSLLLSKLADFLVVCGSQKGLSTELGGESSDSTMSENTSSVTLPRQVSGLPPVIRVGQQNSTKTAKAKVDMAAKICLEKNIFLQNRDLPRNFLSGAVAAELAVEVRKLIQKLLAGTSLTTQSPSASQMTLSAVSSDRVGTRLSPWTTAVEHALVSALKPLGKLTVLANPLAVSLESFGHSARIAIAALGVLGGIDERIKVGAKVWIRREEMALNDNTEPDFLPTKVRVMSICDRSRIAIVQYLYGENQHKNIAPAGTLRVPLSRLGISKYPDSPNLEISSSILQELATNLKVLLIPSPGNSSQVEFNCPMKKSLPTLDEILAVGSSTPVCSTKAATESKVVAQRMTVVRLLAEIRTRSAHVLAIWLKNPEFIDVFLGSKNESEHVLSPDASLVVSALNDIGKECKPASRLQSVEAQVTSLRLCYRDCTKPSRLATPKDVENKGPGPSTAVPPADVGTSSDSELRFRRITDSLQELSLGPLFPYLADIESDSDLSFATTSNDMEAINEDETDSEYGAGSPTSSRNVLLLPRGDLDERMEALQLQQGINAFAQEMNAMFLEIAAQSDGSESTLNFEEAQDDQDPEIVPLLAEEERISDQIIADAVELPPLGPIMGTRVTNRLDWPRMEPRNFPARPKEKQASRLRCVPQKVEPVVAKSKTQNNQYSPSAILECYLSPSTTYDIRVFTGPNPYICSCSTLFNTDSDLLSLEEEMVESGQGGPLTQPRSAEFDVIEDIHQLLVKAWETRVFPFIRRRFRNESERRDGLEQIRNALTLGMIEIARQTVEYLYEENGGIPRDLHLPTLEEVKVEASRFTLERIKAGMHVLIHPRRRETLPEYAVDPMFKTFGLIGEVLEIDESHELVLVESYVESDGLLQRFWYPIKSLEKLAGEKKPPPNSRTVSMLKLHSSLMDLELSLTQLYCRKAYLAILNLGFQESNESNHFPLERPISASSGSISSLFVEVDVGNLQIRAREAFADFPWNGNLLTRNLGGWTPKLDFLQDMGNPSVLFFKDSEELSRDIARTIRNVFQRDGEAGLITLTSQLCAVLDPAAERFLCHGIPLDKEGSFDVSLPEMAFSIISVQGPLPKKSSPPIPVYNRDPCVHVFASNSGDLRSCPVVCYPVQNLAALLQTTTSAFGSINTAGGIQDRKLTAFPPVLVPSDRIKCSIQHGCLPAHSLEIFGIPSEFPLCLLYCQQLISFLHGQGEMTEIGVHFLSILFNFLQKSITPPLVKEWIFNLCSGILSVQSITAYNPSTHDFFQGKSSFINRLFTEVVILYERETHIQTHLTLNLNFPFCINASGGIRSGGQSRSSSRQRRNQRRIPPAPPTQLLPKVPTRASGLDSETKINDSHNFPLVSSYFQSLMELCLNLMEGADFVYTPATLSPVSSEEPSPMSTPSRKSSNGVVVPVLPVSGSAPKSTTFQSSVAKSPRSFKPGQVSPKSNTWKRVGKGNQPEVKSLGTTSPSKQEELSLKTCPEMKWFRQAAYATELLKTFGHGSSKNIVLGAQVVRHCLNEMKPSTSQARLFVIYGAPKNIPNMPVELSIARGLNQTGGIYSNELWFSEDRTEVVVEIRSSTRSDDAYAALQKNLTWYPIETFIVHPSVSVFRVNNSMDTGNRRADGILTEYLRQKIFSREDPEALSNKARDVFSSIFTNCYVFNDNEGQILATDLEESGILLLTKKHLLHEVGDVNLMRKFVATVKPGNFELDYFVQEILKKFGQRKNRSTRISCSETSLVPPKNESKNLGKVDKDSVGCNKLSEDGLCLNECGFLQWCTQLAKDNLCALWRALLETGHDLRLDKCWVPDSTELIRAMTDDEGWTVKQDAALVTYVNELVSKLRVSPQIIHPHEIYLEESLFLDSVFKLLQGIPLENIRTRFAILQHINQAVLYNLLPFVSLNVGKTFMNSIASILHEARYLLFYNTKNEFLHKVFQNSAQRGHEIPPPEVTLDPVKSIGLVATDSMHTMFSHSICQLSQVPSQTFCVLPATGSDPPLALVVKFTGEEVHGIIGSFRHFLARAIQEFKEPALSFFIPCPSAAAGKNKDSLLLRPGPLNYGESRFLQCLGQFIGICLRADVPVPLTLLTSTWRSFLSAAKEVNDVEDDLKEADILTAQFLESFEIDGVDEKSFERIFENQDITTFQYLSMDGASLVPICPGGCNLALRFANKTQFIRLVKKLREKELLSTPRVTTILAGLSTIIPLSFVFNTFTTSDLRSRIAGSPEINLELLKAHTHYQVGLSESDRQIQFFWTALESMTPDELKNFVKFATNQDRLPTSCPCENSSRPETASHVSPFPMKIGPIEMPLTATEAYINQRTIRAETCLFLIRLPPYTTYQVTRDQLLYACNSRDDPLSG